jgi:hypothetical protein
MSVICYFIPLITIFSAVIPTLNSDLDIFTVIREWISFTSRLPVAVISKSKKTLSVCFLELASLILTQHLFSLNYGSNAQGMVSQCLMSETNN